MQVTITAKCTYCARKFNASVFMIGSRKHVGCEDNSRHLCCDDCVCVCGSGHATSGDYEMCEEGRQLADEGYFDATYADEAARFDDWRSEPVA